MQGARYERLIAEAQTYLQILPHAVRLEYLIFCALTALGEYDEAAAWFHKIVAPGHKATQAFREFCLEYIFDHMEAGRLWYAKTGKPAGAAFLPMIEAEETYRQLSDRAIRLPVEGFSDGLSGWQSDAVTAPIAAKASALPNPQL